MDELDQIVDRAIAEGLSDEDIQFIVGEWKASRPMPPGATAGMLPQSTMEDKPVDTSLAGIEDPARREAMQQTMRALNWHPDQGAARRQDAIDHPVRTAAEIAIPGIIGKAVKYVKPALGAAANALEDPVVGGLAGGLVGYQHSGVRGAVDGAVMGAAGGGLVGRLASKVRQGKPHTPTAEGLDAHMPNRPAASHATAAREVVPPLENPVERFMPNRPADAAPPSVPKTAPVAAPSPAASSPEAPIDWRTVAPPEGSKANFVKEHANKTQQELAQELLNRNNPAGSARITKIKKPIYPSGDSKSDKLVAAIRQREKIMGKDSPELMDQLREILRQRSSR